MLAIGPDFADAALICKGGHLHYGGSGFYSNRLEAEASAIQPAPHKPAPHQGGYLWRKLVSPKCFLTRSNCTVRVPRPEMVGAASCEVGHVTQRKVMPKPSLSRPPPKPQPSATAYKKSSTATDGFLTRASAAGTAADAGPTPAPKCCCPRLGIA
jgi:hypothetical protein